MKPKRECGTCSACCITSSVDHDGDDGAYPLQKEAGTPCPFIDDCGCMIYAARPTPCREFSCLWLDGDLPEAFKPDQCGVVFELAWLELDPAGRLYMLLGSIPTDVTPDMPAIEKLATRICNSSKWLPHVVVAVVHNDFALASTPRTAKLYHQFLKECRERGWVDATGPDGEVVRCDF